MEHASKMASNNPVVKVNFFSLENWILKKRNDGKAFLSSLRVFLNKCPVKTVKTGGFTTKQ